MHRHFKKRWLNLDTISHRILKHVAMAYRSSHIGNINVSVINIDIKTVSDAKILFDAEDDEQGNVDDGSPTFMSLYHGCCVFTVWHWCAIGTALFIVFLTLARRMCVWVCVCVIAAVCKQGCNMARASCSLPGECEWVGADWKMNHCLLYADF